MTFSGRDPHRESRRAGASRSVNGPSANQPANDPSRYVLGADGKPLRDRYGRPVMRREFGQRPAQRPPRRTPRTDGRQEPSAGTFRAQPDQTRFDIGPRGNDPRGAAGAAGVAGAAGAYGAGAAQGRPRQQMPSESYNAQIPAPVQRQFQGAGYVGEPGPQPNSPHRNGGRRGGARRKRGNPVKRFFGCTGWIVIALVIALVVFVFWTDSRLSRTDALPVGSSSSGSGTNWLLVGSDSRQGLSEEDQAALGTGGDVGVGRTDTIMVLHIPNSGTAQLVSIPRDSYVNVPGFGEDKINAAFTYGGPQLLAQTVEQATGLGIDHYAEIGMGGLANVVDAVGGVNICVDEPIMDPLAGIDLAAGCQDLEGADALGYVRTRATAMGDLDRVERQREFFAALLDKITSPSTLANPFRAVSLVNHTAQSFMVNEDDHVWHLARVALAMSSGVETQTIPVGGFMDTAVGNVVLWDEAGAQELFSSMQ
ncbi:LCP family protein [Corynebacterium casei]|uniref:LCP family protein n=1 Tax=Corynebacterium casei TaxID=160386 RepID=UPI003F912C38